MRTGKREDGGKPQTEREKESRKRIARDAKNFPVKKHSRQIHTQIKNIY